MIDSKKSNFKIALVQFEKFNNFEHEPDNAVICRQNRFVDMYELNRIVFYGWFGDDLTIVFSIFIVARKSR